MTKNKATFKMPPVGKQYAKQQVNKGMAQVQNPVTRDQATEQIVSIIQQSGMPPNVFVKIGELCEAAIHDPKKYKNLVDFMVKQKLEKAEDMKKPDYQMLASMVVIGKVAQSMPNMQPNTTEKTKQIQQQISAPIAPTQGL